MVYKQGMKKMLLQAFHAVLDDEIFWITVKSISQLNMKSVCPVLPEWPCLIAVSHPQAINNNAVFKPIICCGFCLSFL